MQVLAGNTVHQGNHTAARRKDGRKHVSIMQFLALEKWTRKHRRGMMRQTENQRKNSKTIV